MCSDKESMQIFEDFALAAQYCRLRHSPCFQQCYFFSRKKGDLRGQIKLQSVDISFSYCLGWCCLFGALSKVVLVEEVPPLVALGLAQAWWISDGAAPAPGAAPRGQVKPLAEQFGMAGHM